MFACVSCCPVYMTYPILFSSVLPVHLLLVFAFVFDVIAAAIVK